MSASKINLLTDEIVEKYKQTNGAELEVRFKNVSRNLFEQTLLVASKFKFVGIEQTVNTVSSELDSGNAPLSRIRRQTFDLVGKKISDQYATKQSISRQVYVGNQLYPYSINLSSEQEGMPMPSKSDAEVRVKLRISFMLNDSWRLDLTAVKRGELTEIGSSLKGIVEKMFGKQSAAVLASGLKNDNLTDVALYKSRYDPTVINAFEIELEYVGDKSSVSKDSIFEATKILFSSLSSTYATDAAIKEQFAQIAVDILPHDDLRYKQSVDGTFSMKRLLNNAISITYNEYAALYNNIQGAYLTEKANGLRCVVRVSGKICNFCTTELITLTSTESHETTIVDSEMVEFVLNGQKKTVVLVFDVMMLNGVKVVDEPFEKRISLIDEAVKVIGGFCGVDGSLACNIQAKKFVKLGGDLKSQFESVWKKQYDYDIDGLMIVEKGSADYFGTRWYKWKPIEHNTIDFMMVRMDTKLMGISPFIIKPGYTLYLLFVGIDNNARRKLGLNFMQKYSSIITNSQSTYIPIQFSPSANPNDYLYYHDDNSALKLETMSIAEMRKVGGKIDAPWEIVKIRSDRKIDDNYFGNDYRIAELTYQNYISVLDFDSLWKFDSDGYFSQTATNEYKAKNGFNRFVVSTTILKHATDVAYAIDLAAGRGADLGRFENCRVKQTLFIDVDKHALCELIERKYSMIVRDRNPYKRDQLGMAVHVLEMDLKTPSDVEIERVKKFGAYVDNVDFINCSFALHYFCDTAENLRNLITFIRSMLKKGSKFAFCVLNGAAVFERLSNVAKYNFSDIDTSTPDKYVILKKYAGTKLADFGQTIGIKLPFTTEIYEEPLCNLNYVIKEFKAQKFTLEYNNSFSTYLNEFQSANRVMYNQLSPVDISYISLHNVVVVRK